MLTKRYCIIFLLLIFAFPVNSAPCREVVGYYAGWKWYKRNKLVNPRTIDYARYTIINYAFFKPLANGDVTEGDPWADKNILLGNAVVKNGNETFDSSGSLVTLAHSKGVKVIGSIGGWTWSSVFPGIASDALKRKKFAESCVALIRKYDLDGVDIDWEYPGFKNHQGTANDKVNFTLLLKEIRQELNTYGAAQEKKFMLTAAFGPAANHMAQIEWDQVSELLDIINVMTYNYYGSWDLVTNHNTPLLAPSYGSKEYNVNSSITRLTEFYKVDPAKITLGIAFYGRSVMMKDTPALHGFSTGKPDNNTFAEENGTPSYYNIMAKLNSFNQHRDMQAGVPYLTGKSGINSFVSYDDAVSIGLKSDYAVQMKLRGVVIWDISGDYVESAPGSGTLAGNPLCDAIQKSFCTEFTSKIYSEPSCDIGLVAYPNPFGEEFFINWNRECLVHEIIVVNAAGNTMFQTDKASEGFKKIDTQKWPPGIYFIHLVTASGEESKKVVKV